MPIMSELATNGGMAEWTKATVLKTVMGATSSWVRIPLPPPLLGTKKARRPKSASLLFWQMWPACGQRFFNFLDIHQIDSVPDNWYDFISPICVWELAEALLILSINKYT